MAGRSWLVDKNRFATKIMNASAGSDPRQVVYKSNPTRQCPNCHHVIDNSDEVDDWPGLPPGVKFDPSDPEIIWHLLAKSGLLGLTSHPFIDEFIPTVNQDDGICYTHPKNLPGVKQDGTVSHFFHRAIKAYSTGTRKRRKIHDDDLGDVRWHKTGRTKPVLLDGVQRGCKKIMVLYGGKAVKTNWVMHQYHLGTDEDEKEGDYVVSKIFYQQPQQQTASKQGDKAEQEVSEDIFAAIAIATPKADPVTPKLFTPEPLLHLERLCSGSHVINGCATPHDYETPHEVSFVETSEAMYIEDEVQGIQPHLERPISEDEPEPEPEPGFENRVDEMVDDNEDREKDKDDENEAEENHNWVDSGSQFVLNSQQLVEALSLCDDLLQVSQEDRGGSINNGGSKNKQPFFADYAHLGTEDFKRDLEDCQKLVLDPSNIELDTPPEFRLSQLEFGSQDSFLAWGTGKTD